MQPQEKLERLLNYINEPILKETKRGMHFFYTPTYTYGGFLGNPTTGFEEIILVARVPNNLNKLDLILLDWTQEDLREVMFNDITFDITTAVKEEAECEKSNEVRYGLNIDDDAMGQCWKWLAILGNIISGAEKKLGLDSKEKYDEYIASFYDGMVIGLPDSLFTS